MIIQFEKDINPAQKEAIVNRVKGLKYKPTSVITQKGEYLIGTGKKDFDIREIGHMDGISDIHIVSDDYKLVSKKWKVKPTLIDLGDGVVIEEGGFQIMAGPCSIEMKIKSERPLPTFRKMAFRSCAVACISREVHLILLEAWGLKALNYGTNSLKKRGSKLLPK